MKDTIKSKKDIQLLFDEGARIKAKGMLIIYKKSKTQHDSCSRVAFIAGKKLGNAVKRNKAKRILRHAVLCNNSFKNKNETQYDIIFVATTQIFNLKFDEIVSSCSKALKKLESIEWL